KLISNYNFELERLKTVQIDERKSLLNRNDNFIKWSVKLEDSIQKSKAIQFDKDKIIKSLYRPFTKKSLYYDNDVIERPGQWYKKFGERNLVILTTGR
ncbi:type ISP restriction/modification enzyme, partial [Streptococcus suis]